MVLQHDLSGVAAQEASCLGEFHSTSMLVCGNVPTSTEHDKVSEWFAVGMRHQAAFCRMQALNKVMLTKAMISLRCLPSSRSVEEDPCFLTD